MESRENSPLLIGEACRKWYIAYTMPKAEKKVHNKLSDLGIVSFLPMQKVIRKWSDRKKMLHIPLFPNYIFIYTSSAERFDILKMKEIVKYVSFCGIPATVSNNLIDSLRKIVTGDFEVSDIDFVDGMPIKIIDGPFIGIEGVLFKRRSSSRLLVKIEALKRVISIDISSSSVVPLHTRNVVA